MSLRGGLRVGLLCHRGVGGSAMVAVGLARQLAARGHDVHVVARSTPPGLETPPPGVRVHRLTATDDVTTRLDVDWTTAELHGLAELVASVVQRERLQVLHFHYAVPFAWVVQDVVRRLGEDRPAVVGTLHGTDVSVLGRRPAVRRRLEPALAALDAVTTVSDHHAALATRIFRLPEPPDVIPNFVDLDRFRTVAHPPAHGRAPRLVHVSNFRQVKRPESMARIAGRVLAAAPSELWLVGTGERMPAVESILEDPIADGRVRLLGVRLDVENLLPHTDLLLVSSRMESFCLVALEAMASGVPVVAPRVGGLPELVEHGISGLLFEPGDEEGAARLVLVYLADPALQRRLSAGALTRARSLSTAAVIPRYERLYADVLGRTRDDLTLAAAGE
ncbi:N-acetyl-alpha-D-glucosaminyl L-malate synthase BshA [Petropleomorpha daqingensis]|uniref:N-acetyl-alpha-D-glucosaminyl L-malate synthase BshA n=1 Tax=Petropleomorpha daqingensis TaxID=2026353 RepID=A0A853CEH3_9ACTN|nr:N-acetyl-alpha-D-glucosaminyl L-malate synthase BshA [Petropleomorpha daqingensis]